MHIERQNKGDEEYCSTAFIRFLVKQVYEMNIDKYVIFNSKKTIFGSKFESSVNYYSLLKDVSKNLCEFGKTISDKRIKDNLDIIEDSQEFIVDWKYPKKSIRIYFNNNNIVTMFETMPELFKEFSDLNFIMESYENGLHQYCSRLTPELEGYLLTIGCNIEYK